MNNINEIDKWLGSASFSEIDKAMPYSAYPQRIPTCRTADNKSIFISTLGEMIDVNNPEQTESHLEKIIFQLKSKMQPPVNPSSYMMLGILWNDYCQLALILGDLKSKNPNLDLKFDVDYSIPNEAFEEIMPMININI